MLAATVARVVEHGGWRACLFALGMPTRIRAACERPVVAHIDPAAAGNGLALGQHRHRGIAAMKTFGGEHMGFEAAQQRLQRGTPGADLIGKRRQAQRHAL